MLHQSFFHCVLHNFPTPPFPLFASLISALDELSVCTFNFSHFTTFAALARPTISHTHRAHPTSLITQKSHRIASSWVGKSQRFHFASAALTHRENNPWRGEKLYVASECKKWKITEFIFHFHRFEFFIVCILRLIVRPSRSTFPSFATAAWSSTKKFDGRKREKFEFFHSNCFDGIARNVLDDWEEWVHAISTTQVDIYTFECLSLMAHSRNQVRIDKFYFHHFTFHFSALALCLNCSGCSSHTI